MAHKVTQNNRRIILASGSPRRLELCEQIGFEPQVRVSAIPEQKHPDETPEEYTRRLAREKAADVAASLQAGEAPNWILAADTIVVLDGDVLEKPADQADAVAMLMRLSGRHHEVITSFCWHDRSSGEHRVESVAADVLFRTIGEEQARRYAATGEPSDKAGAYGIQDLGGVFVERIEGSYFTIVGLPIAEVVETLDELGGLGDFPFVASNS